MKSLISALCLALALAPGLVRAAEGHAQHAGHAAVATSGEAVPLADGTIRKIDKAGGRLTVAHGPLPNGMPAMTMAFRVKDAAWLDKLREGQAIRFAIESIDGSLTIVRLEAAK